MLEHVPEVFQIDTALSFRQTLELYVVPGLQSPS
jgi:hypothetical protein